MTQAMAWLTLLKIVTVFEDMALKLGLEVSAPGEYSGKRTAPSETRKREKAWKSVLMTEAQ